MDSRGWSRVRVGKPKRSSDTTATNLNTRSSPETYIKPEYDSDDEYRRRRRENFDSYRPNRFRSDSYRPEPPKDRLAAKGRRSRRSGGFERGVVSGSGVTRGPDPASGANIDRVKEEPVDDIEIKEEPVDDIEMDLTG